MDDFDLERPADGTVPDETDINLRAYFTQMTDDRLREYDPTWSDEQVVQWDGNFRSDGTLMLVCCERDVEIAEYRSVLHEQRNRRRITGSSQTP